MRLVTATHTTPAHTVFGMRLKHSFRTVIKWLAIALALLLAAYACWAGTMWYRYGHVTPPSADNSDQQLDRFMPVYEVAKRGGLRVQAPAETTFSTACALNLTDSPVAKAIFRTRALVLGGDWKPGAPPPQGLVKQVTSWGWALLAEVPGREFVFGTATQPWLANPVFRSIPPAEFAAFHEPGYVKIIWMLRADPIDAASSMARTETRVATTDPVARAKFRRYWAWTSPGIMSIRLVLLTQLRAEAERYARQAVSAKH
ncbi:MAG TPA: hypothetical protein VEJ47_16265 [Candidatus Eremiobacteraceae bacterium]|nr:hypothetical protein [Candidatus Eremiobacteraceae bacterium]